MTYIADLGFSYILALTFVYIGSVTCQLEILRKKVKEFENAILLSALNHNETPLRKLFGKIFDFHNEIFDYGGDAENFLSGQYFVDSLSITFLSAILLFYAKLANWIPGYIAAFTVTFAAFFDYALGEVNVTQLGKLNEDAYNVSWYRLSIGMRKMYVLFLQRTQMG